MKGEEEDGDVFKFPRTRCNITKLYSMLYRNIVIIVIVHALRTAGLESDTR